MERIARKLSHSSNPDTDLNSPQYWLHFPIARAATISECQHPTQGAALHPGHAECLAAYEADYMAHSVR